MAGRQSTQACGVAEDDHGRALALDHCHESRKIRGLLCARCNTAIGLLQDSPEVLRRAHDYLSRHK